MAAAVSGHLGEEAVYGWAYKGGNDGNGRHVRGSPEYSGNLAADDVSWLR